MTSATTIRVMAIIHALFAGAQLLFGAIFAHAANRIDIPSGAWALRIEGAAMVAAGAALMGIASGMVRLRPWTVRIAILYAVATITWAAAAIVVNLSLRATDSFDAPRNLFGLLVVILVHAVALLYDMTRKDTRSSLM